MAVARSLIPATQRARTEVAEARQAAAQRHASASEDHQRELEALREEAAEAEAALGRAQSDHAAAARAWQVRERSLQEQVGELTTALAKAQRDAESKAARVQEARMLEEGEEEGREVASLREATRAAEAQLDVERGRAQALTRELCTLGQEVEAARRRADEAEERARAVRAEADKEVTQLREEARARAEDAASHVTAQALETRVQELSAKLLAKQHAMDAAYSDKVSPPSCRVASRRTLGGWAGPRIVSPPLTIPAPRRLRSHRACAPLS